jgi:hypothetical protein
MNSEHLRLVLGEYAKHYNAHRQHRALQQGPPVGRPPRALGVPTSRFCVGVDCGPIREYSQIA